MMVSTLDAPEIGLVSEPHILPMAHPDPVVESRDNVATIVPAIEDFDDLATTELVSATEVSDNIATPSHEASVEECLIYGSPDDTLPDDGNGVQEMLKITSILEAAGITCCMMGTSALIYFGARRMRGDWQICVPTDHLSTSTLLLSSSPHDASYVVSKSAPIKHPGSLRHTYPRFKRKGILLWFLLAPSEDYHIECSPPNLEWSLMGLPFPKLKVYAQSLVDIGNAVDLCDLIDGMNLSEEWGNQHLDLDGTIDTEWAQRRNARIRSSLQDGESSCFMEVDETAIDKRVFWESRVRKKEHRLGWKYPKEQYATRFRTHKSRDPRLTGRS